MDDGLRENFEKLIRSATKRRADLQLAALRKGKRRKALTVLAGILALTSAGAITTVISIAFGNIGIQLAAALIAAVSGIVSLLVTTYYSENTVFNMLQASAQYLALRENVQSLIINPDPQLSDVERFKCLQEFRKQYIKLDEIYAQYFSLGDSYLFYREYQQRNDEEVAETVTEAERQEGERLREEFDKGR